MNYYEIIMWIETHLVSIHEPMDGGVEITYLDKMGYTSSIKSDSLIDTVLKINELDLL